VDLAERLWQKGGGKGSKDLTSGGILENLSQRILVKGVSERDKISDGEFLDVGYGHL